MANSPRFLSVTLLVAFWADRHQSRGIPVALISLVAVAGYALNLGEHSIPSCFGTCTF